MDNPICTKMVKEEEILKEYFQVKNRVKDRIKFLANLEEFEEDERQELEALNEWLTDAIEEEDERTNFDKLAASIQEYYQIEIKFL